MKVLTLIPPRSPILSTTSPARFEFGRTPIATSARSYFRVLPSESFTSFISLREVLTMTVMLNHDIVEGYRRPGSQTDCEVFLKRWKNCKEGFIMEVKFAHVNIVARDPEGNMIEIQKWGD